MKYTKNQIIISVIGILAAAIAWESVLFTNLFWQPYWNASLQSELAVVFSNTGRNLLFPGILVFFSLFAVKSKMNVFKYTIVYVAGIFTAYTLYQGTTFVISNNLWATGSNRIWNLLPFNQSLSTNGNLPKNLLYFDPFIYWIAGCGICVFDYLNSKKIEEEKKGAKTQLLLFGVISAIALLSLCAEIIVLYRSTISVESHFYYWETVFKISLLWLAYILYIKKLPVLWFSASCIVMFLAAQLLNGVISIHAGIEPRRVTYVLFSANAAVNLAAMFVFFALESKNRRLLALSTLCFALIPLSYVFFGITAMRSTIYNTFGYAIFSPSYGSAYALWFVLPSITAFIIKDFKDLKAGKISIFHLKS